MKKGGGKKREGEKRKGFQPPEGGFETRRGGNLEI